MEICTLCRTMVSYFQGDTRRIQHFLKVHALAKCIGEREGLSAKALHTLEAAALTHDIAIRDCEREFGHCTGKNAGGIRAGKGGGTPALARRSA